MAKRPHPRLSMYVSLEMYGVLSAAAHRESRATGRRVGMGDLVRRAVAERFGIDCPTFPTGTAGHRTRSRRAAPTA